jgi:hypothetical protein
MLTVWLMNDDATARIGSSFARALDRKTEFASRLLARSGALWAKS